MSCRGGAPGPSPSAAGPSASESTAPRLTPPRSRRPSCIASSSAPATPGRSCSIRFSGRARPARWPAGSAAVGSGSNARRAMRPSPGSALPMSSPALSRTTSSTCGTRGGGSRGFPSAVSSSTGCCARASGCISAAAAGPGPRAAPAGAWELRAMESGGPGHRETKGGGSNPAPSILPAGAESQNRTGDTAIFSRVLYQLSYLGLWPHSTPAKRRGARTAGPRPILQRHAARADRSPMSQPMLTLWEILAVAVALAMDVFAVSLGVGTTGYARTPRPAPRPAFLFGPFRGLMTLVGWGAGYSLEPFLSRVDHWVALGLLTVVGFRSVLARLLARGGGGGA